MPTVTTRKGWGQRLSESVSGILVGVLLFLGSFGVLWSNEGRINKSKLAAKTTVISAEQVDSAQDGLPVSTTGLLTSEERIGDIHLKTGEYLAVYRSVEMYSWKEITETTTRTRTGGAEETTTTYDYVLEWSSNPADSSNFYDPSYENPTKTLENETVIAEQAKVGVYDIDPKSITLPPSQEVTLNQETALLTANTSLEGNYIFDGFGTLTDPIVGDLRISYSVVPLNKEVTVFGKLEGQKISAFIGKKNTKLYRAFNMSRDEAISKLQSEHKTLLWGLRVLGFIMMWTGLGLVLKPISTFFDVLPILGGITGFAISAITFAIALVLSLVTIIIAAVLQNIVALVVAVVLILGATLFILNRKKDE